MTSDLPVEEDHQPFLDGNRLRRKTFIKYVEVHESLDSTNLRAGGLVVSPTLTTPALVVSHVQTAGRGRGANRWWSPPGALMFSLVLDSPSMGLPERDWPRLSLTTAVAVCDSISHLNLEAVVRVKWPNDVYLDNRKVAGILIESPANAAGRLIVGVGINVNNSFRTAQGDLGKTGVAICDVARQEHSIETVLVSFLKQFEIRVFQLRVNPAELARDWSRLNLLSNRWVQLDAGSVSAAGICTDIDDDGALCVNIGGGEERFRSGSVVDWR